METGKVANGDGVRRTEMRTVLFVTHTPGYGGTEKHLLEFLSRLGDCGVRPVILCAESDPYTERLSRVRDQGIVVRCETGLKAFPHRPSLPFPKFSFTQMWHWFRVFRETKPEVVVFVYGGLSMIPWFASVAARLAGVRRLFAIQHLIPPPVPPKVEGRSFPDVLRRLIGRRTRLLLNLRVPPYFFDKTICVSDAVRESLVRNYRFPPQKTVTIHNGVSVSEFAPSGNAGAAIRTKLGVRADEFVLVSSARLSEEKGIDILLLAMSRLVQRNISCKCIIVGEGYLRDTLLEQVRTLGLAQHVFMEGFQENVKPYLLAGEAFVLTSYREGLPFAVLEAMACGLPCIVTNVGGNAEAVAHNVNGLVVNPGSVDEVVEAVSYLLTHPQERAQMSRAARTRACEYFDIEARMTEIKEVILNSIDGTKLK
jgi:glycosyltransferase involved in cell wall biosynthesis